MYTGPYVVLSRHASAWASSNSATGKGAWPAAETRPWTEIRRFAESYAEMASMFARWRNLLPVHGQVAIAVLGQHIPGSLRRSLATGRTTHGSFHPAPPLDSEWPRSRDPGGREARPQRGGGAVPAK